jgi:hypothetical protein
MPNLSPTDVSSILAALLKNDLTADTGRLDLCTAILRAALRTARSAEERTMLRLTLSAIRRGAR